LSIDNDIGTVVNQSLSVSRISSYCEWCTASSAAATFAVAASLWQWRYDDAVKSSDRWSRNEKAGGDLKRSRREWSTYAGSINRCI